MNEPHIHDFTSASRVGSETAPELIEPMDAHLSASRTLELLAAVMSAHPELIHPVDTRMVARIFSLVGKVDIDLNSPLSAEDE